MRTIAKFLSHNGMRLLLMLKVLVVAYVIAAQYGWVSWGERMLRAQDTDGSAKEEAAGKDEAATPATGAIKTKVPAVIEGSGGEEDAKGKSAEKSFLDRLFSLPKLDRSNLKKEEVGRYLALMEQKERQVKERLQVLQDQEKQLGELEKTLDVKIKKIEDEVNFFKQTQQKEKEVQEERLKQLVDFYQKMAPKKAAPVFEKLDRDLVVALWKRFPEKQTTQILSLMTPQKSVELSEYFGRIRSAKEYDLMKEINLDLKKEFANCKQSAAATEKPIN